MSVRNCVRALVLAASKKSWKSLEHFIHKFIVHHFDEVRKSAGVFRLLNVDQFRELLDR